MWVFTTRGFVSIVADAFSDQLLVRSRIYRDLHDLFPNHRIEVTPERDYRFRILASRNEVATTIASDVTNIDYHNFKDAAPADLHDPLLAVWSVMYNEQEKFYGSRLWGAATPVRRRAKHGKRALRRVPNG